ncbi:DUF5687 family protein [uncultured Bacteroides sp.]|uniref:DUF5687 family protein n=1 Tax=uncultured Bacteroides sp. TaxID=162156 RepID=UPI002AA69763|nr:DUF5687 family protein [uncultured Bacteroides sp.]
MLFNELRKHHRLAAKRHPMYEKNKFGKYFMYFMTVFWAGYLIFFGTTFALSFAEAAPNMEPYNLMNQGLVFVFAIDFMIRFPFQKTPSQEVKPYLLLPIKRNKILDFLLLRSGLDLFNIIWLFMFIPFAIITVTRFYGITGIIAYSLGIYLLTVLNNYWYLLCRTLMNERIYWIALPVAVYAALAAIMFIPEKNCISDFTMNLGGAFIEGNILAYLGTLLAIACMWMVNRQVMVKLVYAELSKIEDTKVKHVSEYKFLERYGEIGEYFRLELKMLFRNKRCKTSLRTIGIIVVFFSALLSFSDVYDGAFMKSFTSIYAFVAFGMVILTQIMSFEGSYLDGLMTRKESIFSLLKAKYYLYSMGVLIPFILMIPAMVMGKLTLLGAFSFAFFAIGPIYFLLFQLAVYNNKTVPLNEGVTGRQGSGTGFQTLVSFGAFGIPMILYSSLNAICGEVIGQWIMLVIGLAFTLSAHIWINNVYKRFMARRYKNMQGFRDTK